MIEKINVVGLTKPLENLLHEHKKMISKQIHHRLALKSAPYKLIDPPSDNKYTTIWAYLSSIIILYNLFNDLISFFVFFF